MYGIGGSGLPGAPWSTEKNFQMHSEEAWYLYLQYSAAHKAFKFRNSSIFSKIPDFEINNQTCVGGYFSGDFKSMLKWWMSGRKSVAMVLTKIWFQFLYHLPKRRHSQKRSEYSVVGYYSIWWNTFLRIMLSLFHLYSHQETRFRNLRWAFWQHECKITFQI